MTNIYRGLLVLILATYMLLVVSYGLTTPLFEAPDENRHYYTAAVVAETARLPEVGDEFHKLTRQEAAQPPLFYLLSALIAVPFDIDLTEDLFWANPAAQLGAADSPQNINAYVHTQLESWPWSNPIAVAHLWRLFSSLIGLGTLLAIFSAARIVWPRYPERTLLATATVAFLPQFAFLHGSISNDPLIIFLCAATLWQLLRMWYGEMSWSRLILLGLTVGLAILSKTAGLLLFIYCLGFVALLAWRSHSTARTRLLVQQMLKPLLIVAFVALGVSGWLLWRNWQLYGDVTASNQFVRTFGGDRDYSLVGLFKDSRGLWRSTFAVFGWFNVLPPTWVYLIWNGIVLAAIGGAVIQIWKWLKVGRTTRGDRTIGQSASSRIDYSLKRPAMLAALLGMWVILVFAGLVSFMSRTPAAQGRLMFPALLPLALALTYGLSRYKWSGVYVIVPLLALVTSIYSVAVVIPKAYARPAILSPQELTAMPGTYDADLGQGLKLVTAEVQSEAVRPGEWAKVTLYWRADRVPEGADVRKAPQFVIELLGQDLELAGKLQSYHGGGLYPASLWTEGEIIVDRLGIRIDKEATAPVLARAFVRLADPDGAVEVGAIKIVPAEWPPVTDEILAKIEGIELVEVHLDPTNAAPGDTVFVNLRWQVTSAPGRDLTTFVHLGDPSADTSLPPLAQGDSPSLGGYYPTGSWSPGEVIDDHYSLTLPADLPPGRYPVYVGLYDPGTGTRAVLEVDGQRQANDAFLVGWLSIDG